MQVEVVAIGTELLLGQVTDTNGAMFGQKLALAGIDCLYQTKVGDNVERIEAVLRQALERNDAVICCGGLGPTQDDITRLAIANVMGVEVERRPEELERLEKMFADRGRAMSPSNAQQADIPVGAVTIPQDGTAPGLICRVGDKVIYAVPGVPHEAAEMMDRAVIPDLRSRATIGEVILSRVVLTWGLAESTLGEMLQPRLDALDAKGSNPTIAFLASGIEGIKVRITSKASSVDEAKKLLDEEEREVRAILGDLVFGVDNDTMESVVGELIKKAGLTVSIAESMTGGLISSRLVNVEGSSDWFRGGVVAYDSQIKFDVLGVREGPVVTAEAAQQMAEGIAKLMGTDVGLSITGVAGPAEQEGQPVGTVFVGITISGETQVEEFHLAGDRSRIRQYGAISLLNALRGRLS